MNKYQILSIFLIAITISGTASALTPPQLDVSTTMYVGDTYNYNGQIIKLLGINAIHAPYSVNLDVAGYAYTIQDGTHIYASVINADIWISQTSLFSTVMLVVSPNQPTPPPTQPPTPPPTVQPTYQPTATVYAVSNPSGADVFIDGVYKGTTPITFTASVGSHIFKFTKNGYYDNTIQYDVTAPSTTVAGNLAIISPTQPPTPPPTVQPTTPPQCPSGLIWDGTQCILYSPPSDDNNLLYWAAGIIGLGTVVYFVTMKPTKGRR